MHSLKWLGFLLTALLLLQCACGGGASLNEGPLQPPSALTYATRTAVYAIRVPIPPNIPTSSGGAVSSYGVSPALPTGLALNTSTGIISGTPAAPASAANYTVTASNSAGSTTATLNITTAKIVPREPAMDCANLEHVVFPNTQITKQSW